MIRERLAGKRILITGATGFLGQALLERLLFDVPDARLAVLIRAQPGTPGRARLKELLSRPAFGRVREREGADAMRRLVEESIDVVEGDVSSGIPPLPPDLDVVFHCAATVSFDPPIDVGFRTNLLGTVGLLEAVHASGSTPHVVHVSTAYVAGSTKGIVPEAPLAHQVDWRTEADAALAARAGVEEASRKPEMLDGFMAASRREHSRAGPQTIARDAERRRREWVSKRLVAYGRARAQSLGWPDAYTLTKALGERAAEELAGDLPLSIVRPSIVESALREPYPGWIEGFKMAEPIILAYGRGTIPEFPGIPEGICDIIPVDLVVNALLTVAATVPDGGRRYFHVSSGDRNPLSYRRLYELVREYFRREPLVEWGRGEVAVPEWRFPGPTKTRKMLRTGERVLEAADRVVRLLPRSGPVRRMVRQLDRQRGQVDFVRRYADLYGAYVEAEVIYTSDRTAELSASLPDDERERFGFDARDFDWGHYIRDVHCPSITIGIRAVAAAPKRPAPQVHVVPRTNALAIFDMEGTILTSNVVESYLWMRLRELPGPAWPGELASVLRSLPTHLAAERRDRGEFLRGFYRRYEGASVEELQRAVEERIGDLILGRAAPAAIRRVREHRAAGHRTVLITGALDLFTVPLRPLFDVVVAATLGTTNGRYTGYLARPPLVGEARVGWLREFAGSEGLELRLSYGYGDSHSDLPLLRAVGHPVAVNPDVALFRVARKRRWPVEEWHHAAGTSRVLLPEAVR